MYKLGRDLRKTVMIDDIENNLKSAPKSGILIPGWKNNNEND